MAFDIITILSLLGIGAVAGAINAVAGGGMFLVFPSLILLGLSPITANVTGKIALTFGTLSSLTVFGHELRELDRKGRQYFFIGLFGSVLGAMLLLLMTAEQFRQFVPFLLLGATIVFAYGSKRVIQTLEGGKLSHPLSLALQLLIGIYGGFFAAGQGLMMLALYAISGFSSLHHMNALKHLNALGINAISALIFVFSGMVDWKVAALLVIGALIGGYFGAAYSKRLPQHWLRYGIIAYGITMSGYMLVN